MVLNKDNIDYINSDIQEIRIKICNAFLITISILAVPALIASLYRTALIGWQPAIYSQIILAISLWGFTFFRDRIAYYYLAGFIVMMFFIIGIGGIYQFGLVAGGISFFVATTPIATLFFGEKIGISTFIIFFISAVVLGFLVVTGNLTNQLDLSTYSVAVSSWSTSIFSWSLTSAALAVSFYVFNSKLINSLEISRQQKDELYESQFILEKTIEEKNISNKELQKALDEISVLRGIIPICSYCHSVRDDKGAWNQLDKYVSEHSEAKFSHGICPNCLIQVRSEEDKD